MLATESVYAGASKGSPATTAISLLVSDYGSTMFNPQVEFTLCSYFNVDKKRTTEAYEFCLLFIFM